MPDAEFMSETAERVFRALWEIWKMRGGGGGLVKTGSGLNERNARYLCCAL